MVNQRLLSNAPILVYIYIPLSIFIAPSSTPINQFVLSHIPCVGVHDSNAAIKMCLSSLLTLCQANYSTTMLCLAIICFSSKATIPRGKDWNCARITEKGIFMQMMRVTEERNATPPPSVYSIYAAKKNDNGCPLYGHDERWGVYAARSLAGGKSRDAAHLASSMWCGILKGVVWYHWKKDAPWCLEWRIESIKITVTMM